MSLRLAKQIDDTVDRILRQLDTAEQRFRVAVVNALTAAREAPGTFDQLVSLLEQGRIDEAIDLAARAGAIQVSEEYAATYVLSGKQTSAVIEDSLRVVIGFDQVNYRAVAHMQQERFQWIQDFTREQREATRLALTDGIQRGINPRAQARLFRSSIGLTAFQERAVQNYQALLERTSAGDAAALTRELRDRRFDSTVRSAASAREPLSQEQINRMVTRYRERYVKYRSEVIARTEALKAVHSGNREAFLQAAAEGVLDPHELVRQWNTRLDGRERDDHRVAHEQQVRGLEEPFVVGGESLMHPGDPRASAKQVAQCRCVETIRLEPEDLEGSAD